MTQPFDTAPRDGRLFLAFVENDDESRTLIRFFGGAFREPGGSYPAETFTHWAPITSARVPTPKATMVPEVVVDAIRKSMTIEELTASIREKFEAAVLAEVARRQGFDAEVFVRQRANTFRDAARGHALTGNTARVSEAIADAMYALAVDIGIASKVSGTPPTSEDGA